MEEYGKYTHRRKSVTDRIRFATKEEENKRRQARLEGFKD